MKIKGGNSMMKKVVSLITAMFLLLGMSPADKFNSCRAEEIIDAVPGGDIAYVNFYDTKQSRNMTFIDGIAMGITDSSDPLFFEKVTEDGLEGRKQYSANFTYLVVDDSFYGADDHEFVVNIMYYDYGPSEGKYYLEYTNTSGVMQQITVIKNGRNPGWKYVSVVLTDCDLSQKYDNGASLRIQNGYYNTWRRVEIVNVSKHKREKSDITGLSQLGLEKARILELDDPMFSHTNAAKPCSYYDAAMWANKYALKNTALNSSIDKTLTQGELIKLFMDALGVDYSTKTDIVEYALEIGFIQKDSLFLFDSAVAMYYHLGALLNDVLEYETEPGVPYIMKMFEGGYFGDYAASDINNTVFINAYMSQPKKLPSVRVTDNLTGRTFNYINFFGSRFGRPYFTSPGWLHDGSGFLCTTPDGGLYIYNIKTEVIRFIAQASSEMDGVVGEDGMIYYFGKEGVLNTMNRVDPNDPGLESKVVYRFPKGVSCSLPIVSADGKYFGGSISDPTNVFNVPKGTYPVVIFEFPEESLPGIPDNNHKVQSYAFPEPDKGFLNHNQLNPVYTNLIYFGHECDTSLYKYNDICDRANIMDINTGEVINYNQGYRKAGSAYEMITHETWSADGEELFLVAQLQEYEEGETIHSLVQVRKDGTHKQYHRTGNLENVFNHTFLSGDKKFASFDQCFTGLMCLETDQIFPIAQANRIVGTKSEPYHAHARIARNHRLMDWGYEHEGVLGIAWYDFTDIEENEVAKGGRYKVNEYVERVSYENLDCESSQVEKDGKICQLAKAGQEIFYSINPDIADNNNDEIVITFDYLDNSRDAITLTYTKGVVHPNDECSRFNKTRKIYGTATGRWKTATIKIASANCESIGKYNTDFTIKGGGKPLYITNVKVVKNKTNTKKNAVIKVPYKGE